MGATRPGLARRGLLATASSWRPRPCIRCQRHLLRCRDRSTWLDHRPCRLMALKPSSRMGYRNSTWSDDTIVGRTRNHIPGRIRCFLAGLPSGDYVPRRCHNFGVWQSIGLAAASAISVRTVGTAACRLAREDESVPSRVRIWFGAYGHASHTRGESSDGLVKQSPSRSPFRGRIALSCHRERVAACDLDRATEKPFPCHTGDPCDGARCHRGNHGQSPDRPPQAPDPVARNRKSVSMPLPGTGGPEAVGRCTVRSRSEVSH